MDEEGRASEEEDGLLSSGTPTTAIWGMSRSSEAMTLNAVEQKRSGGNKEGQSGSVK